MALAFFCSTKTPVIAMSDTPDEQTPVRPIDENPRVLIISGQGELPAQQIQILSRYQHGLHERDMLVLLNDGTKTQEEVSSLSVVRNLTDPAFEDERLSLYAGYLKEIDPSRFSVTLIGKDQGVKKTWARLIDDADLFGMIDRMPMRAQEMRR